MRYDGLESVRDRPVVSPLHTSETCRPLLPRRGLLACGGWAALGLLGRAARSAEPPVAAAPGFGRAKSVIIVFASGGQSQLETWDPKPDAPLEVRGAFDSI